MVTVLLVEDDSDIRESIAELLEAEGHSVTPMATARAALGSLERPGCRAWMDCPSSTRCARADRDRFRVILMSADRAVTHLTDAPGVVAVLEKPFEMTKLLDLLHRYAN